MDLDPLSIVTPARVKVLLLPIGDIKHSRFTTFVERLQNVNVVRLGDVSPDSRPHRTMFSPLAFPEGLVLYELSTTVPPLSHVALSPFEIHRETLAIVGVVDGRSITAETSPTREVRKGTPDPKVEKFALGVVALEFLSRELNLLRQNFPKALVHQVLLFDSDISKLPDGVLGVPPRERSRTTTVKTLMCDLTSKLLAEMNTHAKSLQSLSSIESPRIHTQPILPRGTLSALPSYMTESLRPGSAAESSQYPSSFDERSRTSHRMSTPVNLPSDAGSRSSTPESRATSPPSRTRTPPTIFNEMNGSSSVYSPPKTSSRNRSRTASRDRGLASGFGSGSLGEKERNKGKARIGVVIGAMYLLAGRWPDAVRELTQSAMTAKRSSDYVWHAKAMDYILVCLLMYAWAGMDFRIPDILVPSTEKSTSSSKSSNHAHSSSLPDFTARKSLDPERRALTLRTLTNLMPDLTNNILNLYARAWTFTDEKLPPLAFSQSAIRFAKLLSAIHLSYGVLDDILLGHLVLNTRMVQAEGLPLEATPFLSRAELISVLFRAYPQALPESTLSVVDYTTILAGIISVLSKLGYHRKKALVLKELLSGLVPALVQARKDGAAEMGVHPAASLANLNNTMRAIPLETNEAPYNDSKEGIQQLLSLVCQAYGITLRFPDSSEEVPNAGNDISTSSPPVPAHEVEDAVSRILKQASLKMQGFHELKTHILRACINLCEALPDLGGALRYSGELLRIGGSGIAPGPDSSDGSPDIPIEEQLRLANNISRTLSAVRHLGMRPPEAEYWDDFLVRGIEVLAASPLMTLLPHVKSELELVETIDVKKETNPFIYNPFLKAKSSAAAEPILAVDDEALFRVTLQNLYDFDVVIERIRLVAEGVPIECLQHSTLIGPYRTQTIVLGGKPKSAGSLAIVGCAAKVRGCRERIFPSFKEPWALKADIKERHRQLDEKSLVVPKTVGGQKGKKSTSSKGPIAAILALNVIGAQPSIVMKSISAPQSAVALLEGEIQKIAVTLQNTSPTISVDLLLVSFNDTATSPRQSALLSKELSPSELYELEIDSAYKQPLKWLRREVDGDLALKPGEEVSLEIAIFGKPGLSYGTIQIDYCHLGIPRDDIKDRFYTRQLMIPLTITVSPSIDLLRNDFLMIPKNRINSQQLIPSQDTSLADRLAQHPPGDPSTAISSTPGDEIQPLIDRLTSAVSTTPHCLLLLDFHNPSPKTLKLTLCLSDPSSSSQPFTHNQTLSPGSTKRLPLSIPRIFLPNALAPIPSLNPANKRQFVVSHTKSSPEAECAMRETFWYREALFQRLNATWKEVGTGRNGEVNLRGLQMTPSMISVFKLPELFISFSITPTKADTAVREVSSSAFQIPIDTFLTLNTTLYNRSSTPIWPLLRLQPSLANQPQHIALDLNKKLLVNGILQRALPIIKPRDTAEVKTGFCILASGIYEWNAVVEEVEVAAVKRDEKELGRERAGSGELDVLRDLGRRIWVAEEGCRIVAKAVDIEVADDDDGDGDAEVGAGAET